MSEQNAGIPPEKMAELHSEGPFLGVDFGRARHGVAVSDGAGILATPVAVVEATPQPAAVAALAKLAKGYCALGIVIGLPLGKDGEENNSTRTVRSFGGRLAKAAGVPVYYQDERYSTEETLARLQDRGSDFEQTKAHKDSWAAALILQDWLNGRFQQGKGDR